MNPMTRTLTYVGVAFVCVVLAVWSGMPTPELNPDDSANVGEPFYPDFEDPIEATGVRVTVFNEDTAEAKTFEVSNKNGAWTIPSHYDYPADGKDQLEKTASSLVAVKRGAVAGVSEQDWERLGVVDPLSDEVGQRKGRGERLTLTNGGTTLLDLIIGNQVDNREGFFYVRHPKEKQTYVAELDLELTTDFGEWIEPDLLQINTTDLREMVIKDYSIDESSRRIVFNDVLKLRRPDASTSWKLEGQKENEKLKTAAINQIITTADNLKIIGVRPKPQGLSSDLKLTGSFSTDDFGLLDLQSKGYYVVPTQGGAELFANEGDLEVVTENGVVYVLRFGEVFTGDEFDIEVGSASESGEADAAEDKAETVEENQDGLKQSRYLFVTVQFDPTVIGEKPEKPTPPAKQGDDAEKSDETADDNSEATEGDEKSGDQQTPEEREYEDALAKYETALADYERKMKAGQEQVAKLNERFADWYYVIDAESFDKLHQNRADLIEEVEPESTEGEPTASPEKPEEKPTQPVAEPAASSEQPEMKAPEEKPEPADDSGKPEAAENGAENKEAASEPDSPAKADSDAPAEMKETDEKAASPENSETPADNKEEAEKSAKPAESSAENGEESPESAPSDKPAPAESAEKPASDAGNGENAAN
ncbi:DUF4340 domain-containing protein [Rubinisphaera sp. JC750]|uniref:DUF4340 domain-containing protein n=1 Tax=Rubinisphaera sp. JC750 TaxID=2898658 RepID=UPI001F1E5716|nr:DUF4340 domain-containing protein [Rubinisphaera sp. JC750]